MFVIVPLLAYSLTAVLYLSEVANIDIRNIDRQHRLIKVKCKGNKEGLAPITMNEHCPIEDRPLRILELIFASILGEISQIIIEIVK